jgi:uncharacterized protein (TIGR03437 family)
LNTDHLQSTFPVTPGAFQTTPPILPIQVNPAFAFLTKLNAAGSALVYSTFLYASNRIWIWPNGLALDAAGSAVIVGSTYAPDFPTTPGALRQCDPSLTQSETGVLFKLAPDGSQALYSTYLGADAPTSVTVDGTGEIYIAGYNSDTLPIVPGSFGWTDNGGFSSFTVKLAPEPLAAGSVSCVVNAATRGGTAIAPGEIVDIFGNGIGPAQPVNASAASGRIPTYLGGVQVLFDGIPAPLLSAGPNQIRAVVPFEIAPAQLSPGQFTIDVQILSAAAEDQPISMSVAAAAPAIFTIDGTAGQALMINQDGTLNSEQNPAPQGSIVTVCATGLNNTQPPLGTGMIATGATPLVFASLLQIGGFGPGQITYAGAAPGFVAGLAQINFRIPVSIFHGFAPMDIYLPNSYMSPTVYFYQQ